MIRDNILKIKGRISLVCAKINQGPCPINIVAVSKGRPIEQIREAIEAGITDIAENRVQEALIKYNGMRYAVCGMPVKLHMVGHLQTNKVRDAVRVFELIQSVDSLHLAGVINKEAARVNKIQDILIEIKTSSEEAKFGLMPQAAIAVIGEVAKLKNINIKGLMTIAPMVDNPEKTRPYFKALRELRDRINALGITNQKLVALSMGMTDDFEVAIEEGSNMVRLGRAIFER